MQRCSIRRWSVFVLWCAASAAPAADPHIVLIAGDDEYRSEESLPLLASILKKHHHCKTTCLFTTDKAGKIDPNNKTHIPGLEALETADMMVLFLRWRSLVDADLKRIADFAETGKPMAGFRTSTHSFKYDDERGAVYNDLWPKRVFGQRWITHHGHFGDGREFLTAVKLVAGKKDHPILRGVQPFQAYSWLYHVEGGGESLMGDCEPLATGTAMKSSHAKETEKFPLTNPVAWTKTYTGKAGKPARVFFTTLGHPFDFQSDEMRRMTVNGFLWALSKEASIPASGACVDLPMKYDPPNSGDGGFRKNRDPREASP